MNILYYFPRALYERKMSLGRVLYGEAVARQPGIDLKVWGSGWDGFDDSQTVTDNLQRQFGASWSPDVLWSYKLADHKPGLGSLSVKHSIVCFNEAHDPAKTFPEIEAARATTVVFHHENDRRKWETLLTQWGVTTARLLHAVDLTYFRPTTDFEYRCRRLKTIVTGVLAPAIYPLRCRFASLINSKRLSGRVRNHPGYRLDSLDACRKQYHEYAHALSHAKVSLCCTSIHRYALAKIVESMAAGCLVVTDFPDDGQWQYDLARFCVRVSPDMNDDDLVDTVEFALKHAAAEKVLAGQKYVLENLTTDHYAKGLLEYVS